MFCAWCRRSAGELGIASEIVQQLLGAAAVGVDAGLGWGSGLAVVCDTHCWREKHVCSDWPRCGPWGLEVTAGLLGAGRWWLEGSAVGWKV